MLTFVFRCDYGKVIGLGHVARCALLARHLEKLGHKTKMLIRDHDDQTALPLLAGLDVTFLRPPTQNTDLNNPDTWLGVSEQLELTEVAEHLTLFPSDWLIADHYALTQKWFSSFRDLNKDLKLAALDDLANRPLPVDVLINNNLFSLPEHYQNLVPKNCLLLNGTSYALLDTERFQPKNKFNSNKNNVLVAMGGTDPNQVSLKVIECLTQYENFEELNIKVALSNKACGLAVLQELAQSTSNIELCIDANLADLNRWADIAFGACGISAWERALCGLPTIMLTTAQNQLSGALALASSGAAVYLGHWDETSNEQILSAFSSLEPNKLDKMRKLSHQIISKQGLTKIADAFEQFGQEKISYRPVREDDVCQLFHWQLQSSTRTYFRNKKTPTFEQHVNWFRQLNDDTELTLIEYDSVACGYVRLDTLDNSAPFTTKEVSILVADGFKGKGIAKKALQWAISSEKARLQNTQENILVAEISEQNMSSKHAFLKAGFSQVSATQYEFRINIDGQ